jgi:type IV pilus assembly protein PilA
VHEPRKKPWAGIIVGGGLLLMMVCLCLSMVLPTFVLPRFNNRARASEAKSNLKAAFVAEKSYFVEKDVYSETVEKMGFAPERRNRYLYLVSTTGDLLVQGAPDGGEHAGVFADEVGTSPKPDNRLILSSIPSTLLGEVGVKCEADGGCDVTVVAAGNIDSDATIDVWSISTKERSIAGETVTPGMPFNHVNDVEK